MTPEEKFEDEFKLQHARVAAMLTFPQTVTNRDCFAMHAMAALLGIHQGVNSETVGRLAATSFAIADAMMQVRDMKKEDNKNG